MKTVFLIIAIVVLPLLALFFLFGAIYMILLAPGSGRNISKFRGRRFAHRGLHDGTRVENSMSAFRAAVDAGFGIELDVRLSSDGVLVVHHDDELGRVVRGEGRVDSYTAAELSEMRLCDSEDTVPTLAEVLELVDGRVPLLVEIKEDADVRAVSDATAKMLADYKGDFIVESFNPLSVANARKKLPGVACGFLSTNFAKDPKYNKFLYRLLGGLLTNRLCSPDFIAYDSKFPRRLCLRVARMLGATTVAWTVRSKEEEERMVALGFNAIIFEGYIPETK